MSIDFRAFEISPSNVKLACDIVKQRFEIEAKKLKIKIRIPKIEAFAVVDEDFERIREERHEISSKRSYFDRLAEWGDAHGPVKDCMAFTNNFRDKKTDEVVYAEIFIRASIYNSNREKFYEILEPEITHVLFPNTIMAYGGKHTRSGLPERVDEHD